MSDLLFWTPLHGAKQAGVMTQNAHSDELLTLIQDCHGCHDTREYLS